MIQAVSGENAKQRRQLPRPVHDHMQRRTDFIGKQQRHEKVENTPHAHFSEMDANGSIPPHFHQVDQFQVLVAGSGSLGRNPAPVIALHYADHHTAYGPIKSGPLGLSFFTFRAQSDPGAVYLHRPDHKDFLKPSKQRYLMAENIALSNELVLQSREEVSMTNLIEGVNDNDGLGAFMLRLGADMDTAGPDPKATAGQFYLVLNGGLRLDGENYPAYSVVYVSTMEKPLKLHAGPRGLEALVLNFPYLESNQNVV